MGDSGIVWAIINTAVSGLAIWLAFRANRIAKRAPTVQVDRERREQLLAALHDAVDMAKKAHSQLSNGRDTDADPAPFKAALTVISRQMKLYAGGSHENRLRSTEIVLFRLDHTLENVLWRQENATTAKYQEDLRGIVGDSNVPPRHEFEESKRKRDAAISEFNAEYRERVNALELEIRNLTQDELNDR